MKSYPRTLKPQFQIRRAIANDAADIARLFLIASDGLAAYVWTRDSPQDIDLLALGTNRYARTGTNFSFENCHVACINGKVVGMIHLFTMPESVGVSNTDPILAPYSELEIPRSLYISGLAVQERWRGNGVGSALLDVAEVEAVVHKSISTFFFEENRRAMQFYSRRGFQEVARRPIVPHKSLKYTEGDAVLLAKKPAEVRQATGRSLSVV